MLLQPVMRFWLLRDLRLAAGTVFVVDVTRSTAMSVFIVQGMHLLVKRRG